MRKDRFTVDRVLVAVNSSVQGSRAVETAADFASHLHADLMALFVEDVNLFKLAELPFARELDRSSGVMRPMDTAMVMRALEVDAEKLRRRLDEESRRRSIGATMKIVRGRCEDAALRAAGKTDIVFIHDHLALPHSSPESVQKPVWVLLDGSRQARRALKLAMNLRQKFGSDLVVVVTGAAGTENLEAYLGKSKSSSPTLHYKLVDMSNAQAASLAMQNQGCAVLILPRKFEQRDPNLDALFRGTKYPRLLV